MTTVESVQHLLLADNTIKDLLQQFASDENYDESLVQLSHCLLDGVSKRDFGKELNCFYSTQARISLFEIISSLDCSVPVHQQYERYEDVKYFFPEKNIQKIIGNMFPKVLYYYGLNDILKNQKTDIKEFSKKHFIGIADEKTINDIQNDLVNCQTKDKHEVEKQKIDCENSITARLQHLVNKCLEMLDNVDRTDQIKVSKSEQPSQADTAVFPDSSDEDEKISDTKEQTNNSNEFVNDDYLVMAFETACGNQFWELVQKNYKGAHQPTLPQLRYRAMELFKDGEIGIVNMNQLEIQNNNLNHTVNYIRTNILNKEKFANTNGR